LAELNAPNWLLISLFELVTVQNSYQRFDVNAFEVVWMQLLDDWKSYRPILRAISVNKESIGHYRRENKDRKREYDALYRRMNKDKICDSTRLYRYDNEDKLRESNVLYRLENKDRLNESTRLYNRRNAALKQEANENYYLQHLDKKREFSQRYSRENKDVLREPKRQYRVRNKERKEEYTRQFRLKKKAKRLRRLVPLRSDDLLRESKRFYRSRNKDKLKVSQRLYRLLDKMRGGVVRESKSWKTSELVREYFESITTQLSVSHQEDWYRISRSMIRNLGGTCWNLVFFFEFISFIGASLYDKFGSLGRALQYAYPEGNWDLTKFNSRRKKSGQRWLKIKLEELLPGIEIIEDYQHPELHWGPFFHSSPFLYLFLSFRAMSAYLSIQKIRTGMLRSTFGFRSTALAWNFKVCCHSLVQFVIE
jgi:hypothetical protein